MIYPTDIRFQLKSRKLKVTPQRVAVYEAVAELKNHPTAENVIDYIRDRNPNIAVGTVYNTLETLVINGLINKVKTEDDVMRYDAVTEKHHHYYGRNSKLVGDYTDHDLDQLLEQYFRNKAIPGFEIEDIHVNITGKFK